MVTELADTKKEKPKCFQRVISEKARQPSQNLTIAQDLIMHVSDFSSKYESENLFRAFKILFYIPSSGKLYLAIPIANLEMRQVSQIENRGIK